MTKFKGGIPSVIEMLQLLDEPSRRKILLNIAQKDEKLARQLEQSLFTFEDLGSLAPKHLQALIQEAAPDKLTLALRRAPEALKSAVLANMPKRQAAIIEDELASGAPRKLSEVKAAQAELIELARRLETEGKLLLQKIEE